MDAIGSDRGQIVDFPRPDVVSAINAVLRTIELAPGVRRTHRDAGNGILVNIKRISRSYIILEIEAEEDWVIKLLDHRPALLIDPSIEDEDKCVFDKELWQDRMYENVVWVSFYLDRLGAPGYIELSLEGGAS